MPNRFIATSAIGLLLLSIAPVASAETLGITKPDANFFSAYVAQYRFPQFFQSNDKALYARIKLIDAAPAGSQIKIATFDFDAGKASLQLARHLCLAAKRGVHAELLVDSKAGDGSMEGFDAFDGNEGAQVIKELQMYLAGCGVRVYVHNHLDRFIVYGDHRMPNIFLDDSYNGQSVSTFSLLKRVVVLFANFGKITQEEATKLGIAGDITQFIGNVTGILVGPLVAESILSAGPNGPKANDPQSGYVPTIVKLRAAYAKVLEDPFWKNANAKKLNQLISRVKARLLADADFKRLLPEIRRFNRLNHRKLFLVLGPDKRQACAMVGGRNLGDDYLVDSATSYYDGDVLICPSQVAGAEDLTSQVSAAFRELLTDRADPALNLPNDNQIAEVKFNPAHTFRWLIVPYAFQPRGFRSQPTYMKTLDLAHRTLPAEYHWPNDNAFMGDVSLEDTQNWHLLRAGWDPKKDEIAQALLTMVSRERTEIDLESAYAQFDPALRLALEEALKRGVHVKVVSNGLMTTDGISKAIRLGMADWLEQMEATYPQQFTTMLTTWDAHHMTHFKGVFFGCQQGENGELYRASVVGSHNFHPRSGYLDKEVALTWTQPIGADCSRLTASMDLEKARELFYENASSKAKAKSLHVNEGLISEMTQVLSTNPKNPPAAENLVRAFFMVVYHKDAGGKVSLFEADRVAKAKIVLRESGFMDLFGLNL